MQLQIILQPVSESKLKVALAALEKPQVMGEREEHLKHRRTAASLGSFYKFLEAIRAKGGEA